MQCLSIASSRNFGNRFNCQISKTYKKSLDTINFPYISITRTIQLHQLRACYIVTVFRENMRNIIPNREFIENFVPVPEIINTYSS